MPSIFPTNHCRPKTDADLNRYERQKNREKKKKQKEQENFVEEVFNKFEVQSRPLNRESSGASFLSRLSYFPD